MIECMKCKTPMKARFIGTWVRCDKCGTKHYISRRPT